ncbi:MAG: helix-turn-helix transcriptional regulator, partial [Geminicoccales bacterium]
MVVNTAAFELRWVVLVYQADDLAERQRIAAIAERAWSQTAGSFMEGDFSPRSSYLPLLILEGEWSEASHLGSTIMGLPWFFEIFGGQVAELARWRGNPEITWQIIRGALSDGPLTPAGKAQFQYGLELQRVAAALALDNGDLATAATWLEAHDRWLAWNGVVPGRAEGQLAWAEWHRASGDLERAVERASAALACASNPRQPLALIAAHRLLGELETARGCCEAAETSLKASLSLAERCAAPFEQARTHYALALLARARGATGEASHHAQQACDICARLGAQPLLSRITALQAEIGAATDIARPGGITRRELEVLRLAAQGLDNAAIAGRLFISPHTVHRHMAN